MCTTILQMSKFKTKDKKGKGEFNSILQKETAQNARGDAHQGDMIFEVAFLKFMFSKKAKIFTIKLTLTK